jgi:predicted RND superfamily exporter protein
VARYLQLRRQMHDCRAALLATTASVGPAILTGAMTTAIAFFAAGFTSFVGVAELGKIAGGGILLCAAAELLVLPAVLYLVDRSRLGTHVPEPLPVHAWVRPIQRIPRLVMVATLAVTLFLSAGLGNLWYDHNLLNLQAAGLESVELERKLLAESQQSCWYALSLADSREELLARKAQLMKLPSVEKTEEIVSLLPADEGIKKPLIARIAGRLARLPERPPLIPVDSPEALGQTLAAAQELLAALPAAARAGRVYEQIRDALRRKPLADCYRLLSQFQQHMAGDLLSRLHALRGMADPRPPQLSDLPESLVNRFVGHNGKYLLKIYGRGNIWDMTALRRFVADVRSVDPRATGNPLQAYEASLEMKRSYEHSAILALLVISVVLLADLRSVRHALLAALPLGLSMVQMFGLLGLLDIPLNPANMIALPLILGIGIDYGVHLVHEYREQRGPYVMSQGTAVAVLVDALTTIVGFGSLMIASHQGLQSLGRVLTLGVTCCLVTSLVSLPALLGWLSRNRVPAEEAPPQSGGTARRPQEPRMHSSRPPHWEPSTPARHGLRALYGPLGPGEDARRPWRAGVLGSQ